MSANSRSTTISSQEFSQVLGRPIMRILLIAFAMFIAGVFQGMRSEFNQSALLLLIGAVASVFGAFALSRALSVHAKSGRVSALSLLGALPFVFGCYLVFYRGLWSGRVLFESLSLGALIVSLAFVYFGYRLVYWTWQLTEIGEALRAKRLIVAS